jgi:hypothetical protein
VQKCLYTALRLLPAAIWIAMLLPTDATCWKELTYQ